MLELTAYLRGLARIGVLLLPMVAASPAGAESAGGEPFAAWLRELKPAALKAGVSQATFDRVFAGLAPDCNQTGVACGPASSEPAAPSWSERTGLPESCNKVPQKEFLEPAAYFPENYIRQLVEKGRGMLDDLRANHGETYHQILKIEETYGVPVPVLLGLWARETGLGEATLEHNAVVALASLAFAGPEQRRPWMRQQLIAALQMIERGDVGFEQFRSSWAGATGLTQIMPGEYLDFAADGDGDGRKDIWNSAPDALATTANILSQHGWQPHLAWGGEVQVPSVAEGWDCTIEDRGERRTLGRWAGQFGIRPAPQAGMSPSPKLREEDTAYLLAPAGTLGPAFLVTENFDALREYNPSDLYALFIGTISDRLSCAAEDESCGFAQSWPDEGPDAFTFTVENICRLQLSLKQKGILSGAADGLFGPQTRAAIGRYQRAKGMQPTCYPSRQLLEELSGSLRAEAMHRDAGAATP